MLKKGNQKFHALARISKYLSTLCVPCVYPVCTLCVPCVYPVCTLCVPCVYPVCTLCVPCVYPVCTLCVPCVYPVCTLCVPCVYPVCTLCVPCVYLCVPVYPVCILNKHAPQKRRFVRANNSPFMTNELYKAIMVRSGLRNKFYKLKTYQSKEEYKRQRNYCVSLLRETKKRFYENLDPNLITDNRKFWKQGKPFFSNKTPFNNNITLFEGNELVRENAACAEILNNFRLRIWT